MGSSWDRVRKEQRLKLVFYCRTGDESAGWGLKERRENGEGLQLAYLFPWPSLCFLLFIYHWWLAAVEQWSNGLNWGQVLWERSLVCFLTTWQLRPEIITQELYIIQNTTWPISSIFLLANF